MSASINLRLDTAKKTAQMGNSLAQTLYHLPIDILLSGPLGAGKTTFVQAFAESLGISDQLSSPTYVLEQRYDTPNGQEFIHIDLYRIEPSDIPQLLAASDHHTGIRCIEWADKLPHPTGNSTIDIRLSEEGDGRVAEVTFNDMAIPSHEEIVRWRTEVKLPTNVIEHCEGVAMVCTALADDLLRRGIIVRREALEAAAQCHDLLRFLDFKKGGAPAGQPEASPEAKAQWHLLEEQYSHLRHESAAENWLQSHGFAEVGAIVSTHGAQLPPGQHATIEQQLLFYADKRVIGSTVSSLQERVDNFAERYGRSKNEITWLEEAQRLEKLFFPDGTPV